MTHRYLFLQDLLFWKRVFVSNGGKAVACLTKIEWYIMMKQKRNIRRYMER